MSKIALTAVFLTLLPISTFAATLDYFISTNESPELKLNPYITDPRGIRAGHLEDGSSTATNLGGGYGIDRIDDDVTPGSLGTATMVIHVWPIRVGAYSVTFFGLSDTDYTLTSVYHLRTGVRRHKNDYTGFISSGAVRTYSMLVTDPNQPPVLVKNATFQTLRQDLATAARTNQVGDAKFVAKLDKILAEGEKALPKNGDKEHENKKEAIEKLRQFIMKLEKAAKGEREDDDESKKDEESEHEKEDKRFVSPTALAALKSDAEALIVQQGGKSKKDGEKDD